MMTRIVLDFIQWPFIDARIQCLGKFILIYYQRQIGFNSIGAVKIYRQTPAAAFTPFPADNAAE